MDNKNKILLVCSPYYIDITSNLIKGASDLLESNSVYYNILNVPGALEIAPAIKLVLDKSLIAVDENQNVKEKDIFPDIKKKSSNQLITSTDSVIEKKSIKFQEITNASPSLEEITNLINVWLLSKSNYLAGKSEINLSKIVSNGLIDRTIKERQNDIKKQIYKEINAQIRKMDLESQNSSRIVVLAELNYQA